jgi:hypothetical protein
MLISVVAAHARLTKGVVRTASPPALSSWRRLRPFKEELSVGLIIVFSQLVALSQKRAFAAVLNHYFRRRLRGMLLQDGSFGKFIVVCLHNERLFRLNAQRLSF